MSTSSREEYSVSRKLCRSTLTNACMQHDDVVKILCAKLAKATSMNHAHWQSGTVTRRLTWLMQWSCGTTTWQKKTSGHDWQNLYHSPKISIIWQEKWTKNFESRQCSSLERWLGAGRRQRVYPKVPQNTSWEDWGIVCVDTEPTARGFETQIWNLLWPVTVEEAMKKGMPILKKIGFKSVQDLPRTAVGFSSNAYLNLPPQLRLSTSSNGEQWVRMSVPNVQGLHLTT